MRHGAKVAFCSHEGCIGYAQKRGVCRLHGENSLAAASGQSEQTPQCKATTAGVVEGTPPLMHFMHLGGEENTKAPLPDFAYKL